MSVMTANFTFRFPPKSGHSYNVPTYAFFADDTSAKWTTTFKNSKFSLTPLQSLRACAQRNASMPYSNKLSRNFPSVKL